MSLQDNAGGILGSLVDFSFESFVTTKLIKALYAIAFALGAIFSIASIFDAFGEGFWRGVGALVLVPLMFLLFIMYWRVLLEVLAVIFRIANDVRVLAEGRGSRADSSGEGRP